MFINIQICLYVSLFFSLALYRSKSFESKFSNSLFAESLHFNKLMEQLNFGQSNRIKYINWVEKKNFTHIGLLALVSVVD